MISNIFEVRVNTREHTLEERAEIERLKEQIKRATTLGIKHHNLDAELGRAYRNIYTIESPAPLTKDEETILRAYLPEEQEPKQMWEREFPVEVLAIWLTAHESRAFYAFRILSDFKHGGERALIAYHAGEKYLLARWHDIDHNFLPGNAPLQSISEIRETMLLRFAHGTQNIGVDQDGANRFASLQSDSFWHGFWNGIIFLAVADILIFFEMKATDRKTDLNIEQDWPWIVGLVAISCAFGFYRGWRYYWKTRRKILETSPLIKAVARHELAEVQKTAS